PLTSQPTEDTTRWVTVCQSHWSPGVTATSRAVTVPEWDSSSSIDPRVDGIPNGLGSSSETRIVSTDSNMEAANAVTRSTVPSASTRPRTYALRSSLFAPRLQG